MGSSACIVRFIRSVDHMSIFAIFIFYGANGLGVFILRRTMPDAKRPYKAWGYPIIPAIYVIFCALFMDISVRDISGLRHALFFRCFESLIQSSQKPSGHFSLSSSHKSLLIIQPKPGKKSDLCTSS